MLNIIEQTVEYQGWGYNALTVGTIGALTFLILEAWGMYKQIRKIWEDRSASVLSVHWFGYGMSFMLACIPYGIAFRSATIVIAVTVLFILHLPILWGIYVFRGFKKHEVIGLCLYSLMLPAMIWLPWMDIVYLTFSMGLIWSFATQPWEMWRAKEVGEVEIRLLIALLLSMVFWATYAFAIEALALMILNPLLFVILTITIVLWVKYRRKELVAAR